MEGPVEETVRLPRLKRFDTNIEIPLAPKDVEAFAHVASPLRLVHVIRVIGSLGVSRAVFLGSRCRRRCIEVVSVAGLCSAHHSIEAAIETNRCALVTFISGEAATQKCRIGTWSLGGEGPLQI